MRLKKFMRTLSTNYLLTAFGISIIIFLILIFFTTKIRCFPLKFPTFLVLVSSSIVIGYQFGLIIYFISSMQSVFKKFEPLFQEKKFMVFRDCVDKRFQRTGNYYFIIILVLIPFILLDLIEFFKWKFAEGPIPPYFYLFEPTFWSLLLDVVNNIFGYLMLFLLANVVWIVFNLILIVSVLDKAHYLKADVFHIDQSGGLQPLRNYILFIVVNYFLIITLAMLSYISPTASVLVFISPTAIISYEIIFLAGLLFLGVVLFFQTEKVIISLIDKSMECELRRIDNEYRNTFERLNELNSGLKNKENGVELKNLSLILDILGKEEAKIKSLKHRRFDLKGIFTFISSFLIPTVTAITKEKLFEFVLRIS